MLVVEAVVVVYIRIKELFMQRNFKNENRERKPNRGIITFKTRRNK